MMKKALSISAVAMVAKPAFAASGPFFSLANTDFVVSVAFLLFVGVLIYFGVHKMLGKMLDERAEGIRSELDEARALREEAQSILASYERKHKEVQGQADAIVAKAKDDAKAAAAQAKEDLKASLKRRMQAAEDQIKSAEAAAVKEVKDQAVSVAVAAASEVIAKGLGAKEAGAMIDAAIGDVEQRLN